MNLKKLTASKVKSIQKVTTDEPVPVYDIEVPNYHNFTLANGLVVHNSKDVLDTIAANVYKINQTYAPQITNNTAVTVAELNAINSELNDSFDDDWIIPSGVTVYDVSPY